MFKRFSATMHCNYYLEVCALIILVAITIAYYSRKKFPVATARLLGVAKLDKSLLGEQENIAIFFDAAISLFKNLNIPIVIEGVEVEKQLELAKKKEIDYIQGYYFSKPLKEEDLLVFLKEHN